MTVNSTCLAKRTLRFLSSRCIFDFVISRIEKWLPVKCNYIKILLKFHLSTKSPKFVPNNLSQIPPLAGAKGEFCFGYDLVTSNCIVSVTMVWYPEMTSNMSKLVSYIIYYFLVFEQPLNYLFHNYLKENWKLVKTKLKLNLVWNDFLQPIFDCVFFLFSRTV